MENEENHFGKTMKNYWSCSKFADWLRGTVKPPSGTCEVWDKWHEEAKQKSFRYWLAEEGLDYLQNVICAPITLRNWIRCYISNRFVTKTHALTSSTLKRGQWHDLDIRLLHTAFDELVDFVETELAHQFYSWTAEDREKYSIPWYRKFLRLGYWRCPEAGLDYLNWAAQLKNDSQWVKENTPEFFGKPTRQALSAQEILMLYNWWKKERPNRPDPHDASGWTAYHDEKEGDSLDHILSKEKNEKESEHERALLELAGKIEKEQDDEDTEMFIRLIKVRSFLWT